MNPFELTGPAFVALFIAGAVVAVITTAVLARARRGPWDDPDGAARTPLTGPELGWLAGGEVRAATAAAATAVHGGHAEVVDGTLRATTAAALAALDPITARVVATATPSAGIGELARAIARDPRRPRGYGRPGCGARRCRGCTTPRRCWRGWQSARAR